MQAMETDSEVCLDVKCPIFSTMPKESNPSSVFLKANV